MSKVQSAVSIQGVCCTISTRLLHFCCKPGSTRSNRVRILTPFPQEALQGLQSLHSVVGHIGSGVSWTSPWQGGPIHLSLWSSNKKNNDITKRVHPLRMISTFRFWSVKVVRTCFNVGAFFSAHPVSKIPRAWYETYATSRGTLWPLAPFRGCTNSVVF